MYWVKFCLIALVIGLAYNYTIQEHPYDKCMDMYETPNDVSECVWILTNK